MVLEPESSEVRLTADQRRSVEEFRRRHRTGMLVLLFSDVVGSTEIKGQMGDAAGIGAIQRQRALVRALLASLARNSGTWKREPKSTHHCLAQLPVEREGIPRPRRRVFRGSYQTLQAQLLAEAGWTGRQLNELASVSPRR